MTLRSVTDMISGLLGETETRFLPFYVLLLAGPLVMSIVFLLGEESSLKLFPDLFRLLALLPYWRALAMFDSLLCSWVVI